MTNFLFIIQILVYAGAIIALVVFVIMLLNVQESDLPPEKNFKRTVVLTLIFLSPLFALIEQTIYYSFKDHAFEIPTASFGTIQSVGQELYQNYVFSFEMVSILLLVALVGVVTLAKRKI